MPASSAIRAGRAFVELFADDSKLVRGLRQAQRKLQSFATSVRAMGTRLFAATATITAPLGGFAIKAASDAEESLSRFRQVFGDQADVVQDFADDLARQVGRSKYAIYDALSTFQSFFVGLGFAPTEARELSESMQALAIDFASFNNLSDQEAVERFISALSGSSEVLDKFGVNIKQAALEQELLSQGIDKSWSKVTEQEKAVARLAVIMRSMSDQGAVGDAVRTSESFANQMKALKGQLYDTAVTIGQALLPVVTPLVSRAAQLVKAFAKWAAENQTLIATVFKIAAAIAGAGLTMIVFGFAVSGLASTLGVLAAGVVFIGSVLGLAGTALAALLSPIGAVASGVVVLGSTLLWASGAGANAIDWLITKFQELKDEALKTFRGLGDALAAGDLALAARILWLSLKLQWDKGIAVLKTAWTHFRGFFVDVAQRMLYGAVAAFEQVWHGLEVAWIESTAFLSKTWSNFTSGFQKAWGSAVTWTENRLHDLMGLLDETYDADQAKAMANDALASRNAEIDEKRNAALSTREAERQQQRDASRRTHEDTLAVIGQQYEQASAQLASENEQRRQQTQADLDQARQEWEEALAQAAEKRTESESTTNASPPTSGGGSLLDGIQSRLAGLGDALNQTAAKLEVRGTFNAAVAQQLLSGGGGDYEQRIADASEQTASNTKRLVRDQRTSTTATTFV